MAQFADRVRELRDKLNWTQTELAEYSGIAPAALSRILNGDRTPRMEHLTALARALETTVTELIVGTEVDAQLEQWVPRAEFAESERRRVEAIHGVEAARAEARARATEADALRAQLVAMSARLDERERESASTRLRLEELDRLRGERMNMQRAMSHLEAESARLTAQLDALEAELNSTRALAFDYHRTLRTAHLRVEQLQRDLAAAEGRQLGTGVVGAALGAIAITMMAPEGSSKPRRRR